MRAKVCCVVQRYGEEVNGGAELHCRLISERLKEYSDIDVLTTKALDYITWEDYYTEDTECINGVMIHRFSVLKPRHLEQFNVINQKFMDGELEPDEEEQWMDEQGPLAPELLEFIAKHKNSYDVFIFFTYLYYTTVKGLPLVREKSILVPDAHDEPFLSMGIIRQTFLSPKAIFFNTDEERKLVRKKFSNMNIRCRIGGAGVEVPDNVCPEAFKEKYNISDYIIYVGRIDEGKNCRELFDNFKEYKNRYNNSLKLVLMGREVIEVPDNNDIISLGFVSDEDKFNGIAGAKFLVLPSRYESLSIVILEAFALNIPVLVNGECSVLREHCLNSNGGLYYEGINQFCKMAEYLLVHPEIRQSMGHSGNVYVKNNYQWDVIVYKLKILIDYVMNSNLKEEI